VPAIPMPRRLENTSIGGRTWGLFCAAAGTHRGSTANATQVMRMFSPMTQRSFVYVRAWRTHRVKIKSDAKDAVGTTQRCGDLVRDVVGEFSHAFAPALPSPLRKTAPYGHPVHRLGD